MRAAIYHEPLNITTEDVANPAASPDGIVIKVHSCGICGSDLHLYRLGLFIEGLCRQTDEGLIPGHEYCGEVVEVGASVRDIAVGDRVVAYSFGGMAEYVPVSPALVGMNVHKIPDTVPSNIAATLEPLANSIHAARKGRPAPGETAVVFGAGIIGLGVVQALKAMDFGLKKVIAVDVSDTRLDVARRVGADDVINARDEDVTARALELAGAVAMRYPSQVEVPDVDIVYDCVGLVKERPETPVLQHAIDIVKPGTGRVVVHGVFEAPVTLELTAFVGKETEILGSFGGHPDDTAKGIELLSSHAVDRATIISHEFPLEQAKLAFDTQLSVDTSVKVLINPS